NVLSAVEGPTGEALCFLRDSTDQRRPQTDGVLRNEDRIDDVHRCVTVDVCSCRTGQARTQADGELRNEDGISDVSYGVPSHVAAEAAALRWRRRARGCRRYGCGGERVAHLRAGRDPVSANGIVDRLARTAAAAGLLKAVPLTLATSCG